MRHIQAKDHLAGNVKLQLGVTEQGFAPNLQVAGGSVELCLEPGESTAVLDWPVPRTLDSGMEVWKLGPKGLEAEASSAIRGIARRQDQRAMIGTRRSRGRQPVGGEEQLPAYITEEFVYAN